jgi:hypothetical protein
MAYVERLWATRMFLWFAGIAAAIALVIVAVVATIHSGGHRTNGHTFGVGSLFSVAGYLTCIMATMLSATLNRDRDHLPYIWTRPQSRARIALSYIAVDIGTILIAYAVIVALCAFVVLNVPGGHIVGERNAPALLVRYLALPLMWFAIIEAATSWNALKGSAAAGLSWAVFWLLLALAEVRLPAPLSTGIALLNLLNPLAYFITREGHSTLIDPVTANRMSGHLLPVDYTAQTVIAYAVVVAACAIAVYTWSRMEA